VSDAPAAGPAVVRRLWRRVLAHGIAANLVGVAAVVFILLTYQHIYTGGLSAAQRLRPLAIMVAGVVAIGVAVAIPVTRIIAERSAGWVIDERTPDADDLRRIALIPRLTAVISVLLWCFGTAALIPLYVLVAGYEIETGWRQVVATLIGFAYGALVAAFLSYLLAERELRPILASVIEAQPERWPPSTGVSGRLLIAWFAVAGAPLIMLGYYSLGITSRPPPNASLKEFLPQIGFALMSSSALAAVVGLAVFIYAGRAITTPLGRVQKALRRVADGDLSVQLEVGESGEIGLLQAGFNQMVRGLRERERMRDLFGRHVGVEVAQRAMTGDNALGGENRTATAMFVDVIASTQLAQTKTPDEVVEILNAFFDAVVRAVGDEDGLINKFAGDGAMCIFGAPHDQPDHAARALRAARRLRDKLDGLESIEAAIGISSGEVVAGNVGSLDRYEYTVVGDPVNEAARLTEQAKMNSARVLASERCVGAAGDEGMNWSMRETLHLRGRSEPTVTYAPKQ
jgi:adenylate cyclase